ncbi:MAG: YHS domain-containing (seleno)protein [Verrucomicrobiota bacterium]
MNNRLLRSILLLTALIAVSPALQAKPDADLSAETRTNQFDLKKGLAIQGYDPVSYFSDTPQEGKKSITSTYKGVTYRFANEANKQAFEGDPAKYEPAYGGWCAWAMVDGGKTEVDPENYKIVDGRLMLFYKGFWGDTRKMWNEKAAEGEEPKLVSSADGNWANFTKNS